MQRIVIFFISLNLSVSLSAGIIRTEYNFQQKDAVNSEWTKSIDVNQDGIADITFAGHIYPQSLTMVDSANLATCILYPDETPDFLDPGDSINDSMEYMSGGFILAGSVALMPTQTTTYIGFKVMNRSTLTWRFGWLSIKLDWIHDIFYIKEAAFNDEEEKPIKAGQGSLSVGENILSRVKIFPANSGLMVENLPSDFKGKLLIHDLSGRLLFQCDLQGTGAFISGISRSGIALVTLNNGQTRYSRKIFL